MALVASLILNNFFGTSFVIYSIAPIGWLLLGWLSARSIDDPVAEQADHVKADARYMTRYEPSV